MQAGWLGICNNRGEQGHVVVIGISERPVFEPADTRIIEPQHPLRIDLHDLPSAHGFPHGGGERGHFPETAGNRHAAGALDQMTDQRDFEVGLEGGEIQAMIEKR